MSKRSSPARPIWSMSLRSSGACYPICRAVIGAGIPRISAIRSHDSRWVRACFVKRETRPERPRSCPDPSRARMDESDLARQRICNDASLGDIRPPRGSWRRFFPPKPADRARIGSRESMAAAGACSVPNPLSRRLPERPAKRHEPPPGLPRDLVGDRSTRHQRPLIRLRTDHPPLLRLCTSTYHVPRPSPHSTTMPLTSSLGGGCRSSMASKTFTKTLATTRSRYHLRSAGTTYQGAKPVEVFEMASSYARW